MGWQKPVVSKRILSGSVHDVMTRAATDVAVYVERSFEPWKRVLVPFRSSAHDDAALEMAGRIGAANHIPVTVLHVIRDEKDALILSPALVARVASGGALPAGVAVKVVRSDDSLTELVQEVRRGDHDLVVIGVAREWGLTPAFFGMRHERLARETKASLLIIRRPATRDEDKARLLTPLAAAREAHEAGPTAAPTS
jgi:nucleotide-binding universal stress UspA family protein